MKLFAPRNNWDMKSANSYWGQMGAYNTSAGLRVTEDSALNFSAWFSGVRVIAETLASLPCAMLDQVDDRTTRKATGHSLWNVLHNQPNPEQDSMVWFDSQVSLQVGWGNAYSEKQYNTVGDILALWPIHPSRIPPGNIRRNPTKGPELFNIYAGQPGEIVYYINNDDGSKSAIPASDMFHVPGVLSRNGITGQSIVRWAANAVGIGLATEEHAGAFFKNGASPNIAITSPKTVGKETADRLREQWQNVFGGVKNHYKTLLLEEGMEAKPFMFNPNDSQLVASRQFSVTEIARFLRLPPHMLGDLSRATFGNIEQQSLEFVIYSMMPWVVRWERAMFRQLLTPEEKKRYRFRFNVNGLLRGDANSRSQFYRAMFDMGAFSPNDILALEDMNPVEGGDQRFIPGNNLIPLTKAGELAQAQIDKVNAPPAAPKGPEDAIKLIEHRDAMQQMRKDVKTAIEEDVRLAREQFVSSVDGLATERAAQREAVVDQREVAVRDAIRLSLASVLEGMMGREARAARQAAERPEKFLSWREEFYSEFKTKLESAIGTFSAATEKLGVSLNPAQAASDYVAESVSSLEPLADLSCGELAKGFERVAEAWKNRPAAWAAKLMGA